MENKVIWFRLWRYANLGIVELEGWDLSLYPMLDFLSAVLFGDSNKQWELGVVLFTFLEKDLLAHLKANLHD